jgi:hypothetical protein
MGRAMREIRTLRATWRGLETWCGSGPRATQARQPSTLPAKGSQKPTAEMRHGAHCLFYRSVPSSPIWKSSQVLQCAASTATRAITAITIPIGSRSGSRPGPPGHQSHPRCGVAPPSSPWPSQGRPPDAPQPSQGPRRVLLSMLHRGRPTPRPAKSNAPRHSSRTTKILRQRFSCGVFVRVRIRPDIETYGSAVRPSASLARH